MRIRLLLIDDHTVFREIAARVISGEPDMEVLGQADSVAGALDTLNRLSPDLVLLDYDLRGRNGLEFVPEARKQGFSGKVLIVSAAVPDGELRASLRHGVSGLFLKEESLDRLLSAIRGVAEGRIWFDDNHLQAILHAPESAPAMTGRERQILRGVLDGLSNKEIANRLEVPESTVKSGMQLLFKKTGVRTRASLVKVALEKYRHVLA